MNTLFVWFRQYKILVCGGRDFCNEKMLYDTLAPLVAMHQERTHIIHGGARGADTLAACFAKVNDLRESVFPADWNKHGRAAGPIRNQQMLDEGRPDIVVAFPGGRGTEDMIRRARAAGVKVLVVPE